jgi:hypothetical protein
MSRLTVEHGACSCRRVTELYYHEGSDEYLCEQCLDNANEAAYDRQQAANLESPPESAREEQLRTWKERQEAHKR